MPRLQNEPSAAQLAAREAGAARLRAAAESRRTSTKKTRPVRSTRRMHEAAEEKVGQDGARDMPSTGAARIEPSVIERVDKPVSKEKLELLKFAEEFMTIMVHDTNDKNDDPIPYVINGGMRQAFIRGQEQRVRRKFVEILARLKVKTYSQEKYKDPQGIDGIRNIEHTALKWPFTVIEDNNPRGRDWLKSVLAEA